MMTEEKITIAAEGKGWIVLDKPAGVSVHNQAGGDLVSFLKESLGYGIVFPIHRLDQGTRGLCLFGKSKLAAKALSEAFSQRQVSKKYLARAQILRRPPEVEEDAGIWRWPLTNRAESRRDPKGYWAKRVPCISHWRILAHRGVVLDLELSPETGRQHQLRRHLAIRGWPLLGDKRYGPKECPFEGSNHLIAFYLGFDDPDTGLSREVCSRYSLPDWSDKDSIELSQSSMSSSSAGDRF